METSWPTAGQHSTLVSLHTGALPQPELQAFDSPELDDVREYQYKKLPSGKKSIRLIQLQSGGASNTDITCQFLEAEYDTTHVPISIKTNIGEAEASNGTEELTVIPKCYDSDADPHDPGTKKDMEAFEKKKRAELKARKPGKKRWKASGRPNGLQARDPSEQHTQSVPKKDLEYEALSWCWGTDGPKYAIRITEGSRTYKIKVRRELALALKYLRSTSRARTLWIDAICINQDDPEERNHQVQMMSRIYTRAAQVCVWLGEATTDSRIAIPFIKEKITKLKDFDKICSDEQYAPKWKALMALMQAPWFSRRWVVQEISLARQATVYCGADFISWRDFVVAVELFVEVETATHRLSEIMQKVENYRHVPGWFEYISQLGASLLVQATGSIFRAKPSSMNVYTSNEDGTKGDRPRPREVRTIDPLARRSLLSLEYLVCTMFIFKATEPRDVVYSLLGIARDASPFAETTYDQNDPWYLTMTLFDQFLEEKPFRIDYSRPYSDVCRDFVHFVIRRKSKLDPIQALDILCRPWSLEQPKKSSIQKTMTQDDYDWLHYKKGLFPKLVQRKANWKRVVRQNEIRLFMVDGRKKWKIIKKKSDEWVEDKRTTEAYRLENESKTEWMLPSGDPEDLWKPAPGFDKIKQWCTKYRKDKEKATKRAGGEKQAKQHPNADAGREGNGIASGNKEEEEGKDLELPTWVARASHAPFNIGIHPGMTAEKTGRANADPLVGQPSDGHRNYNAAQTRPVNLNVLKFRKRPGLRHYSMYVQGFVLDEVDEVRDASQGGMIPKSWLELGGWGEGETGYNSDPPDDLWRTLVADRGQDNRNPPYYYARACRESVLKGGISGGRVDTPGLINSERNSIVAAFCRRVHAAIRNRRMFKTVNRRLGLAYDAEKGDKICILYGCTVPVILKKNEKRGSHRSSTANGAANVEETDQKPGDEDHDDLMLEKFEDDKEALKACIRQLEQNCERKVKRRPRKIANKNMWLESGEYFTMLDAKDHAEKQLRKDADGVDQQLKQAAEEAKGNELGNTHPNSNDEKHDDGDGDEETRAERPRSEESSGASEKQVGDAAKKEAPEGGQSDMSGIGATMRESEAADQGLADVGAIEDKSSGLEVAEDDGTGEGSRRDGNSDSELKSAAEETEEVDHATTFKMKYEEAKKEDPYLYYNFRGDCYLHGMMDGEAMTQKFYEEIPDRIFELR